MVENLQVHHREWRETLRGSYAQAPRKLVYFVYGAYNESGSMISYKKLFS